MKRTANSSGGVLHGAGKWVTWTLTTAAALTALLVNARNLGLTAWFGAVDLSFADHAAYRVVVTPRADSLFAVGDTAVLAATVTDRRGAVLTGALLHWRTEDSNVVAVDSAGTVVARGPGRTRVTATVRDLTAGAMIFVLQRPARVLIAGDSSFRIRQGDTMQFAAIALDARGHRIANAAPRWRTGDSTIITVDSLGTAIAHGAGRTRLWATAGEGGAEVAIDVERTASIVAVVSGADQRAPAGKRLADPVVIRALGRDGQPVPGTTVSFSTSDGEGQVDPITATADREGRVRVNWTLSPHPGPQRLIARIGSVDSAFTVGAEAEPVPGNTRVELIGVMPAAPAGLPLPQPVVVRFTDTAGAALVGIPVTWTLLDGGSVEASARTDSLGTAAASWTLSPRAGKQRLLAQVGSARTIPRVHDHRSRRSAGAGRHRSSGRSGPGGSGGQVAPEAGGAHAARFAGEWDSGRVDYRADGAGVTRRHGAHHQRPGASHPAVDTWADRRRPDGAGPDGRPRQRDRSGRPRSGGRSGQGHGDRGSTDQGHHGQRRGDRRGGHRRPGQSGSQCPGGLRDHRWDAHRGQDQERCVGPRHGQLGRGQCGTAASHRGGHRNQDQRHLADSRPGSRREAPQLALSGLHID